MWCRPSTSAMLRALELLLALGALDSEGALSPLGRQMVRLPVEPIFAKVWDSSCITPAAQECHQLLLGRSRHMEMRPVEQTGAG